MINMQSIDVPDPKLLGPPCFVWGTPDQGAVDQMLEALKHGADYGALMADHHIGYSVPIGAAIAYEGQICVNGVGYDIGCGNKAVRLDLKVSVDELRKNIYRIMNEIEKHISFGMGLKNKERVEHEIFDEKIWQEIPLLSHLKDKARAQLGTVGGGNHYVDIFVDELQRLWVGVHFGSRGLGHSIATHFVRAGGGVDGTHAAPVLFDERSDLGEQYIKCMQLAGRYAYAGRDWVCQRVAKIIRADIVEEVHNHHNFAWQERHFGTDYWVVRKGATPAFPGQRGFVGGSMGHKSYIIEGTDGDEARAALYSTIHGAGRRLGRSQAKGKKGKDGTWKREPLVKQADMDTWINSLGVELRGGDVDEAPQCYKAIDEVIAAHNKSIKVIHTLKPIGVCMAGSRDHDPYRD